MTEMANKRQRKKQYKKNMKEIARLSDSRKNDKAVDLDEMIAEVNAEDQYDNSSDWWNTINNQVKKYGAVDTPEVDWRQDVEMNSEDDEDE